MDPLLRQDKCKICFNLQPLVKGVPPDYFSRGFTVASLQQGILSSCPYCSLISYAIHNLFQDSWAPPRDQRYARFRIFCKQDKPFFIRDEWIAKNSYPIEIYIPGGRFKGISEDTGILSNQSQIHRKIRQRV